MEPKNKSKNPTIRQKAELCEMVRSMAVLLNTANVYHTNHPVFKRALGDRKSDFTTALKHIESPITLSFDNEQVSLGGMVLEPGNEMFRKLASNLKGKGVSGLYWSAPPSETDILGLVEAVNIDLNQDNSSLQDSLTKRNISRIQEAAIEEAQLKPGKSKKNKSETKSSSDNKPVESTDKIEKTIERSIFQLDLDDETEETSPQSLSDLFEKEHQSQPEKTRNSDFGASKVRLACHRVLDDYEQKKISKIGAAESLTQEFEENLKKRVEEVRRENEVKIRRLENVKNMVMEELEQRGLAALVVNHQMRVLSMNNPARVLLGKTDSLDPNSPLADFIRSDQQKETICIGNNWRQAHMIISGNLNTNSDVILICLEPC